MDTVTLTFGTEDDDRLQEVKTHYDDYYGLEIDQTSALKYGEYLNSKGKTESVLISIRQDTKVISKKDGTEYVVKN